MERQTDATVIALLKSKEATPFVTAGVIINNQSSTGSLKERKTLRQFYFLCYVGRTTERHISPLCQWSFMTAVCCATWYCRPSVSAYASRHCSLKLDWKRWNVGLRFCEQSPFYGSYISLRPGPNNIIMFVVVMAVEKQQYDVLWHCYSAPDIIILLLCWRDRIPAIQCRRSAIAAYM